MKILITRKPAFFSLSFFSLLSPKIPTLLVVSRSGQVVPRSRSVDLNMSST
jgi:hypothetical protein